MAADFERAVELVLKCGENRGRVVVTGMGKSGIIAQKIAATLSSTGAPALFLHPGEAVHGDIGGLARGRCGHRALGERRNRRDSAASGYPQAGRRCADQLLLRPAVHAGSGERRGSRLLRLAGGVRPWVGAHCLDHRYARPWRRAGYCVSQRKGFRAEDFADLHPGGKLGRKLARVRELMHSGEGVPQVAPGTPMHDVIYEMSKKRLGMTTVTEAGKLVGLISDGDLRRLLERDGAAALEKTAGEAMNHSPKTISAGELRFGRWMRWNRRRSRHWWLSTRKRRSWAWFTCTTCFWR